MVASTAPAPQRLRGLVARSGCLLRVGTGHIHTTATLVPHPGRVCTVHPPIGRSLIRAARRRWRQQLRRRRRCLARSERVHRVRGRLLQRTDHQVRRHDVGNTPIPKTAPHRHQLQSSSIDCSRAQKVGAVRDLGFLRIRGTGQGSMTSLVRRQDALVSILRFAPLV